MQETHSEQPRKNSPTQTAAVIGGGIIGAWAALHLAESGVSTTLFEQFPLPHTRGSSHGLSRAFRFLGEHELGRLDYSLDRWQALEAVVQEALFVKTGLLNFGPAGDPDLEHFMGILRAEERRITWLDGAAIAGRYPMLRYPEEWGAAFDPDGGLLIAHRCLAAVQSQCASLGGRLVTGRVEAVSWDDATPVQVSTRLTTTGETRLDTFDSVVLCAGPWTSKLAPDLDHLLKCIRTPVTYWSDRDNLFSATNGAPILFNARLSGIYGLPSLEYPGLVKMLYHGGPETNPRTRDAASFESYVAKVHQYVERHLPFLDHRKPAILETCMYTMTPDGNPVIDRLADNVAIGCGFSGSGFKHAPATGRMLAAAVTGQEERIPQDFGAWRYRLSRFTDRDVEYKP